MFALTNQLFAVLLMVSIDGPLPTTFLLMTFLEIEFISFVSVLNGCINGGFA